MLFLNRCRRGNAAAVSAQANLADWTMERETRTILLVDGTSSILSSLEALLKRLDYRVVTARSAAEALRRLEQKPSSLVITETTLPDMSGVVLLERLKNNSLLHEVPVIILTGDNDPDTQQACYRIGCSAYLLKPVDPELLYRTLQIVAETVPRVNIRLRTSLRAVIGDGSVMGGSARTEEVLAISEGGMYVQTRYPQPRNALTPVRVLLPDREIRAKALVLYAYVDESGPYKLPGMGMKFVELADGDQAAIRMFIEGQLAQDKSLTTGACPAGAGSRERSA